MRVDLPKTGPAAPANVSSPLAPTPAEIPRQSSRLDQWLVSFTRWRVAGPLVGATIAILAWTVTVRMPVSHRYLKVHARMLAMSGSTQPPAGRAATPDDVASLQRELASISRQQVGNRRDLLPLLNQLEATARDLGWKCDRALRAAHAAVNGETNLMVHPVDLRLTRSGTTGPASYPRLLEWLSRVDTLPTHSKIVAIDLHSDAAGISGADVKLHFFTLNAHEETAAK